jgi:hypothetical protein
VLQSNTGARPSGSASGEGRKKSGDPKRAKGSLAGGKTLEREKERRRDEEKDSLLARIGTSFSYGRRVIDACADPSAT